MATFKHISSKNANYGDAEKYLTFAHDEFTMKPTLDADGRLVPREDYRISTLNCGEKILRLPVCAPISAMARIRSARTSKATIHHQL